MEAYNDIIKSGRSMRKPSLLNLVIQDVLLDENLTNEQRTTAIIQLLRGSPNSDTITAEKTNKETE